MKGAATEQSRPTLSIVIVAWKGADLTIACLESLESQVEDLCGGHVYVVDNASPDGAAMEVEKAIRERDWHSWATVLRSARNGGFASGNNLALQKILSRGSGPELILLLNPDTLARPGAIRILADFMGAHPDVGVAGGRSEDPDETPQCCAFRFPSAIDDFASNLRLGVFDRLAGRFISRIGIPERPQQVDWVSGAFMMVRREVLLKVGLMDEGYFLYFEETDFTLRARKAGWLCWHVPQARIVHYVGQSSGVTVRDRRPARLPVYWFESRRRYFILNHGRFYAIVADLAVIVAHALWQVRRVIQRRPSIDPPFFISDLLRHGALLHGRKSLKPRAYSR